MADTAARRMSADEFLEWCTHQEDERYEFVDGMPVLMAGGTARHDQVIVNLIVASASKLRGGPCAPRTADQAIKTMSGNRVRRPDMFIDCGERDPEALYSRNPVAVFEVLSPSTKNVTFSSKVGEYKGVPSIRHIVLIEQDRCFAIHYSRAANDAWTEEELTAMNSIVRLAALGIELSLAEIYAEVSFPEAGKA